MNKKITSLAVGAAFAMSLTSGMANAASNPFGMSDLQNAYQVAMSTKPAEGKCGDSKSKSEGKCGDSKSKGEGKCGGSMSEKESKCGGGMPGMPERNPK